MESLWGAIGGKIWAVIAERILGIRLCSMTLCSKYPEQPLPRVSNYLNSSVYRLSLYSV